MALLKPLSERPRDRVPSYVTISCPFNGHQVSWCMGFCEPVGTLGHCGRLAPHAMKGRTQIALENFVAKHGAVLQRDVWGPMIRRCVRRILILISQKN